MTKQTKPVTAKPEAAPVEIPASAPVYKLAHKWTEDYLTGERLLTDTSNKVLQSNTNNLRTFAVEFAKLYANNSKAYRKGICKALRKGKAFEGVTTGKVDGVLSRIQQFANCTPAQQKAILAGSFVELLSKYNQINNPPKANDGRKKAPKEDSDETVEKVAAPKTPDGYVKAILALAQGMYKLKMGKEYTDWCKAVEMGAHMLLKDAKATREMQEAA